MLGLLAGFRWFDNPRFMGATGAEIPRWQRIDVIGRAAPLVHHLASSRSWLSVVAIARQGPEPRHRLQGRHAGHVHDAEADVALDVRRRRSARSASGRGRPGPRHPDRRATGTRASRSGAKSLTRGSSRTSSTTDLSDRSGRDLAGVKNVSSSFSRQILRGAIFAIVVSFLLIALYVTFRFQWRFADPDPAHAASTTS